MLSQDFKSNEFLQYCALRKDKSIKVSAATTKDSDRMMKADYSTLKEKAQTSSLKYISEAQMIQAQKQDPQKLIKVTDAIPCMFLPGLKPDKIVVFFHGNGEDISSAHDFGNYIGKELGLSILIMEYRGYSVCGGSPSAELIVQDACWVMNFLISSGFEPHDIIIFGRSIGGAIAFEVASKFPVCSLILLSPFLSLKKIAEDLYGNCASCLIKETLDNESNALKVACPVLIVHGIKDKLVPYQHSISILGQCKGYSRLKLVAEMTHIKFNFRFDFILPLKRFLEDMGVIGSK